MTLPLEPERFAKLTIFFPMWNEEQYIHRAVGAARTVCDDLVTARWMYSSSFHIGTKIESFLKGSGVWGTTVTRPVPICRRGR